MKRTKVAASPLGDQLRTFAAAYAANGQREHAEGLVQASYTADAHLAGTTTGIVDPIVEALLVAARATIGAAERVAAAAERVTEAADRITESAADLASAGELVEPGAPAIPFKATPIPAPRPPATPSTTFRRTPPKLEEPAPAAAARWHDLDAGASRVLVALRQAEALPDTPGIDRSRLAMLTEYAPKGGRFVDILRELRTRGLVDPEVFRLTAEGAKRTAEVPPLPYGARLLEHWLRKLPKGAADVLGELAAVYPRKLSPAAIAQRLGRQHKGGNFVGAVSRLRRLHLVSGKRELIACDDLFDSDRAQLPAVGS